MTGVCAHMHVYLRVTGPGMSVCVSVSTCVCVLADILKRCKVRVHVSPTQLSPPELFIKSLTALSAAV